MFPLVGAHGIHLNTRHQQFHHLPLGRYIVGFLNDSQPVPELLQQGGGFVVMRCKGVSKIPLGLDGAEGRPQGVGFALAGIKLPLGLLNRNLFTPEEGQNLVTLQGFLTQGVLQAAVLLDDARRLLAPLFQLPARFR